MKPFVAGDVGGTKTLLALCNEKGAIYTAKYHSRSFRGISDMLKAFSHDTGILPESGVLAVAGPVENGQAEAVNLGWQIDARIIANETDMDEIILMNDLEAAVYGLDSAASENLIRISGVQADRQQTFCIIAPGTGLGQAAGIVCENRSAPIALATEGGHAGFSPFNPDTSKLYEFVCGIQGCGHVSIEDVCSGRGLRNLYMFWHRRHGGGAVAIDDIVSGDIDPVPEIVAKAVERKCGTCLMAAEMFLDILASEAGNMAIRLLAGGGLFIGGGLVPRLLALLDRKRFIQLFTAKGIMKKWLGKVPVNIVTDPHLSLYGAVRKGILLKNGKPP